jgi:site-specific DNA recombinase
MEATNPRVISSYETRSEEMENRKLLLMEKTQNACQPVHSFRQMFELSM